MKLSERVRSRTIELFRYFGFPLFAVGVVVIAFFATQSQVEAQIRSGTYQILRDATQNQRVTLERYIDLLTTRVQLVADYDSDTGPNTLVESLRTELTEDADRAEIGFANQFGDLLYSDQTMDNVADQDWFSRSIAGETVVQIASQDRRDDQEDVLVSARVKTKDGLDGVLFATINGARISELLDTNAYDGAAYSFICDAKGKILFLENGAVFPQVSSSIFDAINDDTLTHEYQLSRLKKDLGATKQIQFRFIRDGINYYAVSEFSGISNWYIVSIVCGDAADTIQRQVGLYQLGMLFIMLLMGAALTIQAFNHERTSVQKLERDKDLLQQSAMRYQLITQLSKEVFFEVDLDSGAISFNDSFEAMFGVAPPDCSIYSLDHCAGLFFESDQKLFFSLINRLRAGASEARDEMRMVNARGVVRWKLVEIFTIFDQGGQATRLVGKIADIDRQKQSMQRLIRRADSEPLTGLLNRAALERSVKEYLAGEGADGRHALLILDFDNFKAVNDTLGHARGDNLLVSFASGMKRLFRAGDYLSRIGGDEYMVFIKDIYDDADAQEKGEALRSEMSALSKRIGIPVSISAGIAIYPQDAVSFEKLYHAADEALYQVKKNGKNAVAFFSKPMQNSTEGKPAEPATAETGEEKS